MVFRHCSYVYVCLLLFMCRSSSPVTIIDEDFNCYSSNECRGNSLPSVGQVEDCCVAGGGLSYQAAPGVCANCYDEQNFASEGSQFFLGIFDNHHPHSAFEINRLRIAVDPLGKSNTSFTVEAEGKTTTYTGAREVSLKADDVQINSPKSRDRGILVQSLNGEPLSVVAYSEEFVSSDSFKVLPCIRLPSDGYEYYAVSVLQSRIEVQKGLGTGPSIPLPPEGKSALVIVSTEDNTVLKITLTRDVFVGEANDLTQQIGGDVIKAGETVTITLPKAMETLYLASNDDLTGSRIVSNRPISFTSGHECGTLPNTLLYCDQMMDQIPPTGTWGKSFIAASFATRSSNDTVKIIASRNDTNISVRCDLAPAYTVAISEAGGTLETVLLSNDSCYFESNNPVLLVQFSRSSLSDDVFDSDPFMVVLPPIEQYRSHYVLRTFNATDSNSPPGEHYVNILLPGTYDPNLVLFDGEFLPNGESFVAIFCEDLETVCAYTWQMLITGTKHTLSHADPAARINAIVYWYSFRVGQGYFAGMTQQPVALPRVSMEALNNFANESEGEALFLIRRSNETNVEARVVFETSGRPTSSTPATAGEDYDAVRMEAVLLPGETEVIVAVPLRDDVFPEQEFEHFEAVLSASPGVFIDPTASFVNFTIRDDDPPLPVVNVSVEQRFVSVSELAGSVQVGLVKTNNAVGQVSVIVSTMDGTAQGGDDYVSVVETVTFSVDETRKNVIVMIRADRNIEDFEEFSVVLSPLNNPDNPFPVRVNQNEGTTVVGIRDEEVAVIGFTQASHTVFEGDQQISVEVGLLQDGRELQRTIEVFLTAEDRAAFRGSDYEMMDMTLTFSPDNTSLSIPINIIDDSFLESQETFALRLLSFDEVSPAVFSPAVAVVTIFDNDRGIISLEPLRPLVREGDGSARVTVSLQGGSFQEKGARVDISTSSLTAIKGEDFNDSLVSSVQLSQQDVAEEVLIPILDDNVYEGADDETFNVRISLPSCSTPGFLTIENGESIVSIQDNDIRPVPRIGFSFVSYSGVEGTQLILPIEGDGRNQEPVVVRYDVLRTGTAAIGIDVVVLTSGTVTLPAGGPASAAVPVTLVDDAIAEGDEFFLMRLSVNEGAGEIISGRGVANVTVIDNDVVIFGFETTEYFVSENAGVLAVNILKFTQTTQVSSVRFITRDVQVESVTHVIRNEVLEFQPSETSRTVLITLVDDQVAGESLQVFNLLLSSVLDQPVDTEVRNGLAQVFVSDDDEFQVASLSFGQSQYSVAEDDGLILLEVVVNNPENVNEPIEVSFSCDNGTAVGGLQFSGEFDYIVNRTRINILPGTISTFVEVGIIFDNRDEGTEVFFCRLDAVPGQSSAVEFPDPDRGIVPIFISDQVREPASAVIQFSQSEYSASEGDEPLSACVNLVSSTGQFLGTVSLEVTVFMGTIDQAVIIERSNVNFNELEVGGRVICVQLAFENDNVAQGDRRFSMFARATPIVEDESVTFTRGGDLAFFILIDDDEPASAVLRFSQPAYSAVEGSNPVLACITLTSLTGQFIGNVSVQITIREQTMNVGDTTSANVTLTEESVGEDVACIELPNQDDNILERTQVYDLSATAVPFIESETVVFSRGADRAEYTLTDDEVLSIGWESLMYTADEGIGSVEVCLVVRRDITLQDPLLEIILTTSPGEAQGRLDYIESVPNLEFESGPLASGQYCAAITIIDDNIREATECFFVAASFQQDDLNVVIEPDNATVCIMDNDSPPSAMLAFSESNYIVTEGNNITVCINIVSLSGRFITDLNGVALVGFGVFRGPLVFENRNTMTEVDFAEVEVGQPVLCESTIITDDNIVEQNQTSFFSAFVEGPEFVTFIPGGDEASVTVVDNDVFEVGWEVSTYTFPENIDEVEICMIVLSNTVLQTTAAVLSVFSSESSEAIAGLDYLGISDELTFEATGARVTIVDDELRACVNVTIIDDEVDEPVECFDITGSTDDARVAVRVPTTTICIVDDDPPVEPLPGGFLPFGSSERDSTVPTNDDFSSEEIQLSTDVVIFGSRQNRLYVNTNGVISFGTSFLSTSSGGLNFSSVTSPPIIAPFWDDVNTRSGGTIYYRQDTSPTVADLVNGAVRDLYPTLAPPFQASLVFVATWDRVAPFINPSARGVNTFQAVIASDGSRSFVRFTYGDIQWGGDTMSTLIGVSAGDQTNFIMHPLSLTENITSIANTAVTYRIDAIPMVRSQCQFNQTSGNSVVTASCTTSGAPPDTPIEFVTCEFDGNPSDICQYPSFSFNTDDFSPVNHRLALVLRVGNSLIQLSPDFVFVGTAPTTGSPLPPSPSTDPIPEIFLVSCNIGTNVVSINTALVNCAATVGRARVSIDSCVLDSNPVEFCEFPSFTFPLSNLEPGDHTLTITFSDTNSPDMIHVETLMFTSTIVQP